MAELIEITEALEKVQDFTPVQRVFLTCTGTLQGTLSAYFGAEVKVHVVNQAKQSKDLVERTVEMKVGNRVVCTAASSLTIKRADILESVMTKRIGIGQILEQLEVRTKFQLLSVGKDPHSFWREYELKAKGVTYNITEEFPLALYTG